jgi:hypothetical protein
MNQGVSMKPRKADPESIRLAMDLAWRDHHHMREQTWRALQVEAALAAGLVGIDWQIQNIYVTVATGILVMLASVYGVLITLHHRKGEIRKFTHILNCEEALGLHTDSLLPLKTTKLPTPLRFVDALNPRVQNTSAFILRMHTAILIFAVLYIVGRLMM